MTIPQDHSLLLIRHQSDGRTCTDTPEFLRYHGDLLLLDACPDYLVNERTMREYSARGCTGVVKPHSDRLFPLCTGGMAREV